MSASSSFKFLLLCFISSIFLSLHVTNIDFSALYFVDVDILYAAGIQLVYSGTTLNFIYATFEIKKPMDFFGITSEASVPSNTKHINSFA